MVFRLLSRFLIFIWALFLGMYSLGAENYPSYPDVWGYELPLLRSDSRYLDQKLFKRDNGDILITYVNKIKNNAENKRPLPSDEYWRGSILFFSGKIMDFSPDEFDMMYKKNKNLLIRSVKKIIFDNGDIIEVVGHGHKCHHVVSYSVVKKDKYNKELFRKYLFFINKNTKTVRIDKNCEGSAGLDELNIKIENIYPSLYKLNNNNFIIYEPSNGNLVVRFDEQMNTGFNSKSFSILDQAVVDDLKSSLFKDKYYNEQIFHDELLMLITRSKGEIK